MSKLLPHQERVIRKIQSNDCHGLIVYHSMGSGKTLTALVALELFKGKKLVVAPASVLKNYNIESIKHGIPIENTKIISYEKMVRNISEISGRNYDIVIFDEAHRLRNTDTQTYSSAKKIVSKKFLCLTGTAEYNQPSDLGVLINLINSKEHFPESLSRFEFSYIDQKSQNLKNIDKLQAILKKYVDYHAVNTCNEYYPRVIEENIYCNMSAKQEKVYHFLAKQLPWHIRRMVRKNLPVSLKDCALINMFSTAIRQASLSIFKYDATATENDCPKILFAFRELIKESSQNHFRAVVYSNYIETGIIPYRNMLISNGIEPLVFTGEQNAKEKSRVIEIYNSENPKSIILLLSSSGGEGIDLKCTNLVQILEPHFNMAKISQVKSRAIRYLSHETLPVDLRVVKIQNYFAVLNKTLINKIFRTKKDTSIDEFLYLSSLRKQKIIDEINHLMENNNSAY
jgi:SNF2 family DNA or RNA helicase